MGSAGRTDKEKDHFYACPYCRVRNERLQGLEGTRAKGEGKSFRHERRREHLGGKTRWCGLKGFAEYGHQ